VSRGDKARLIAELVLDCLLVLVVAGVGLRYAA
jgi:hypothetical protein